MRTESALIVLLLDKALREEKDPQHRLEMILGISRILIDAFNELEKECPEIIR